MDPDMPELKGWSGSVKIAKQRDGTWRFIVSAKAKQDVTLVD